MASSDAATEFLNHLDQLDVPIWTETLHQGSLTRPLGWQGLTPDGNQARIQARPAGADICANMGGPIAVVDVDTKNGAQVDMIRNALEGVGITIWADILTPSGGRHFYVAGHADLPTVHAKAGRDGLQGYPGVEILSHGTNTFLPGSQRDKYGGAPYAILDDRLGELPDWDGDEDSALALVGWVANHRVHAEETFDPDAEWDGTPPDARQTAYLAAAVQRRVDNISAMGPESGRNNACFEAGLLIGNYAAGAGLDAAAAGELIVDAARACGLVAEDGEASVRASIQSGIRLGRNKPRAVPPPEDGDNLTFKPLRGSLGGDLSGGRVEAAGDPTEPGDADSGRERTSWWPAPIRDRAEQAKLQPAPTHLKREDGQPLFYSGKVNGLLGESESGKSWLAFHAVQQAVDDGQRCLILDFEDDPAGVNSRLSSLGVERVDLIDYADPDETLGALQAADLGEALRDGGYEVVVLDGVNAAMTLLGLDLNSNTDATKFSQEVLKPLTEGGACVIAVDHVPKNTEARGKGGIGAQAKRAMTNGCAITVEVTEPFGRGQNGKLRLTVDKDRAGHVRGAATEGVNPGTAHIDSEGDEVRIRIGEPAGGPAKSWKPTQKMEAISRTLEAAGDQWLTFNQINATTKGTREKLQDAVKELIAAAYVEVKYEGRSSLHRSLVPYREIAGPNLQVVRGGSEVVREPANDGGSGSPFPFGGGTTPRNHQDHEGGSASEPDDEPLDVSVWSDCNQCGKRVLDETLAKLDGICYTCHRERSGDGGTDA